MDGPDDGAELFVVVYRIAKGSGDPLARPIGDPEYDGKNIHVPGAEVGDVVKIEIVHVSPMHVVGEIIERFEETVDEPRTAEISIVDGFEGHTEVNEQHQRRRLCIRRKNDYQTQYEEQVERTRKRMPDRP